MITRQCSRSGYYVLGNHYLRTVHSPLMLTTQTSKVVLGVISKPHLPATGQILGKLSYLLRRLDHRLWSRHDLWSTLGSAREGTPAQYPKPVKLYPFRTGKDSANQM